MNGKILNGNPKRSSATILPKQRHGNSRPVESTHTIPTGSFQFTSPSGSNCSTSAPDFGAIKGGSGPCMYVETQHNNNFTRSTSITQGLSATCFSDTKPAETEQNKILNLSPFSLPQCIIYKSELCIPMSKQYPAEGLPDKLRRNCQPNS